MFSEISDEEDIQALARSLIEETGTASFPQAHYLADMIAGLGKPDIAIRWRQVAMEIERQLEFMAAA